MNYIFTVKQQLVTCNQSYIVADSVDFCQASFVFDNEWDGYTKTVLFTNRTKKINKSVLLDDTNTCYIPWEIITGLGYMSITIRGDKEDSIGTTAQMCCPIPIYKSGADKDVDFNNLPTPDVYNQILQQLQRLQTGGMTEEEFNTFLTSNEEFIQAYSQIHQNTAGLANLTTQMGEIDAGVHILDERVQGIGTQLGQQIQGLVTTNENVTKNLESITKLDTEMTNAQNAINQNMNAISQLNGKVDDNSNKIEVLEDKVADLESKEPVDPTDPDVPDDEFQALKKQVAKNTIDIATNTQNTQQALQETETNKHSIETVSGKVDTNISDIDSLKVSDTSQNQSITQLDVKVQSLQEAIDNLESGGVQTVSKALFEGSAYEINQSYPFTDDVSKYDYIYIQGNVSPSPLDFKLMLTSVGKVSEFIQTGSINVQQVYVTPTDEPGLRAISILYENNNSFKIRLNQTLTDKTTVLAIEQIVGIKFVSAEDYSDLQTQVDTNTSNIATLQQQIADIANTGGVQTVQKTVFEGLAQEVHTYNFTERIASYDYLVIEGYSANPGQPSYFCELVSIPTILPQRNWWWERDFSFLKVDNTIVHSIIALTFDSAGLSFNVAFNRTDTPQDTSNAKTNAITKMTALKFVSAEDYTNLQTQVNTNTTDITNLTTSVNNLEEEIGKIGGSGGVIQTTLWENSTNDILSDTITYSLNGNIEEYDYIYISGSTIQTNSKIANSISTILDINDITQYGFTCRFNDTTNDGVDQRIINRSLGLLFLSPTTFRLNTRSNIDSTATYMTIRRIVGWKFTNGSNNYSTKEQLIGKWIDGKPLYQKVVFIDSLPNATSQTYPHNVENAETIYIAGGFLKDSSGNFLLTHAIPMNATNINTLGDQMWNCNVNLNDILFMTGVNRSNESAYVILNYTKTTDNAS